MSEYRVRSSGEVKTQGEIRKLNPNTSFPRVWDSNVCEALGIDPVLATPKPEATGYTKAVRNGVTQDANGNWVQAWSVVDMFSDTAEATKAEQEAAYQAQLDEEAAKSVRAQRDAQLAASDWVVTKAVDQNAQDNLGIQIPVVWVTYRQALRDITAQAGFPHNVTWPDKP